jgi:hypothetical protein
MMDMKKFILLMAIFFASILTFAQTNLTEAVDFTGTDIYGNEFNLFEILDGGQYVCIDFFRTT